MSETIRSIEIGEYDDRNRLLSTPVSDPTWDQFLGIFHKVQKHERCFAGVTITLQDGSFLIVDGSDGLFFTLYQAADGFQFQPLPDASQPDGDVTIICGGVKTTLPRAYSFDEQTTLRVI